VTWTRKKWPTRSKRRLHDDLDAVRQHGESKSRLTSKVVRFLDPESTAVRTPAGSGRARVTAPFARPKDPTRADESHLEWNAMFASLSSSSWSDSPERDSLCSIASATHFTMACGAKPESRRCTPVRATLLDDDRCSTPSKRRR